MSPKPVAKGQGEGLVVDFSDVKPFEPLEEMDAETGKAKFYLTTVTAMNPHPAEKGQSVAVELTITKPDVKGVVKRKLFREFSLTPQALPFFHGFLRAIGETDLSGKMDVKAKIPTWIGSSCAVTVKNETYEEQIRSRVDKIYPASKYQD